MMRLYFIKPLTKIYKDPTVEDKNIWAPMKILVPVFDACDEPIQVVTGESFSV